MIEPFNHVVGNNYYGFDDNFNWLTNHNYAWISTVRSMKNTVCLNKQAFGPCGGYNQETILSQRPVLNKNFFQINLYMFKDIRSYSEEKYEVFITIPYPDFEIYMDTFKTILDNLYKKASERMVAISL